MKPVVLNRSTSGAKVVVLPDGRLLALESRCDANGLTVTAACSTDVGKSWSERQTLLAPAHAESAWLGLGEAHADRDGYVHLFLLRQRDGDPAEHDVGEARKDRMRQVSLSGCIDIWHCRARFDAMDFPQPTCLWHGYTGALNSVVQLRGGRLLLPFSFSVPRTWGNRGRQLEDFTYWGYFRTTLLFSDDSGRTWRLASDELRVPVPDISYAYGAVEPVIVERSDGKVWMLIRTQMERFYGSLSDDGLRWSAPEPTELVSSDSPAGLARLRDGRLVLLWNACLRFPYAYGGRHVLHAAVSEDDGATWVGFREAYRDPLNDEPPPLDGDHGTAYPYPTATPDGNVIFFSGQGEGRRALCLLDPRWLYETEQSDDFAADGLTEWSTFGTRGIELADDPQGAGKVLKIANTSGLMPAAAVRNFPIARRGRLRLRLRLNSGCEGAMLILTDHFSVPFDWEDDLHSVFNFAVAPAAAPADAWHEVELAWDCGARVCRASLDGRDVAAIPMRKATPGPCYLRLRGMSRTLDTAGFYVRSVAFSAG